MRYNKMMLTHYAEFLENLANAAPAVLTAVLGLVGMFVGIGIDSTSSLITGGGRGAWFWGFLSTGIPGFVFGWLISIGAKASAHLILCIAQIEENTRQNPVNSNPTQSPKSMTSPISSPSGSVVSVQLCPKCRTEVPSQAKYCPFCSARL